jgi:hypothetical protein
MRATVSGPVRTRSPVRTNSPCFRTEVPLAPSTSRSTGPAAYARVATAIPEAVGRRASASGSTRRRRGIVVRPEGRDGARRGRQRGLHRPGATESSLLRVVVQAVPVALRLHVTAFKTTPRRLGTPLRIAPRSACPSFATLLCCTRPCRVPGQEQGVRH